MTTSTFEQTEAAAHRHRLRYMREKQAAALQVAGEELAAAAHSRAIRERNLGRPSVLLGVQVSVWERVSGCEWIAEYGGVIGTGPTPDEACHAFDLVWVNGNE